MNIKCFLLEETGKSHETVHGDGRRSWSPIYRRADTGEEMLLRDAPVGAIWRAEWYEDCSSLRGADGRSYECRTPGGDWLIDGEASNCTRKGDESHKCWCRHGVAPIFTVNKVGNTCSAGAGSIIIGNYHGFLINGELINC